MTQIERIKARRKRVAAAGIRCGSMDALQLASAAVKKQRLEEQKLRRRGV